MDSEEEAELEEEHGRRRSRAERKTESEAQGKRNVHPPRPFLAASSQIGPRWTGTVDSPARSWRAAPWRVPDPKAATCGLTRTLFCPSHSFPKTKTRKTKKNQTKKKGSQFIEEEAMEDTDEDEDADGEGPSKKRSKFIDDMAAIGEDDEDLEDFDMEDPFLMDEQAEVSPPPPPLLF